MQAWCITAKLKGNALNKLKRGDEVEKQETIKQEAGALSHLSVELGTWQKIATAPRDGTTFLARYGQDGVSIARFNENSPDYPLEYIDFYDDGSLVVNHSKVGEYCIASHWMPLPQ